MGDVLRPLVNEVRYVVAYATESLLHFYIVFVVNIIVWNKLKSCFMTW